MTFSLNRLLMAVIVAVVVGILLVGLLGPLLVDLKVPVAKTVGEFFINWGFPLGLLAGVAYYVGGFSITRGTP